MLKHYNKHSINSDSLAYRKIPVFSGICISSDIVLCNGKKRGRRVNAGDAVVCVSLACRLAPHIALLRLNATFPACCMTRYCALHAFPDPSQT